MKIKIWDSTKALSAGLIEQEAEECGDDMVKIGSCEYLHGEGREWHRTRESASARAEVMRKAKILSLRRQLKRLDSLRFCDEQ